MFEQQTRVPSIHDMDDQILIKHMMARHAEDLAAPIDHPDPGKTEPTLRGNRKVWVAYHEYMHRLYGDRLVDGEPFYDHVHKEAENAD